MDIFINVFDNHSKGEKHLNLLRKGKEKKTKFHFYLLKKMWSQLPPPPLYLSSREKDTLGDVFVNFSELNCS